MADLYGLLAEFATEQQLLKAAQTLRAQGFKKIETFTPYPVPDLAPALQIPTDARMRIMVFLIMLFTWLVFYLLQYYAAVWAYPHNVGGKPHASWPAFMPSAFVLALLVAGVAAAVIALLRAGLPQPYHPVAGTPAFELNGQDGFYLCIEAQDPQFDVQASGELLRQTEATHVTEVRL